MKKMILAAAAGFIMMGSFVAVPASAMDGDIPPPREFKNLNDFLPVEEDGAKAPFGHKKHFMDEDRPHKGKRHHNPEKMKERHEKMMERIENLPPEEREAALKKMEEMKAKRKALKEELEALPPEEREARMKELKEEWEAKREERHEEFREKFNERWEEASPEERAKFCENATKRCEEKGPHACEFAKKACASE